jgi:hypothetical protein
VGVLLVQQPKGPAMSLITLLIVILLVVLIVSLVR